MTKEEPKVMVFHPDILTRAEIRAEIEATPGIEFLKELSSLRALPISLQGKDGLDILILGIDRPTPEAVALVKRWLERFGLLRFVAVLAPGNLDSVRSLAAAGVTGFVAEGAPTHEFANAIRTIWDDGAYLSQSLFRGLFHNDLQEPKGANAYGLTPREREILMLICVGLSNKDIARRLDLSVRTVETHRLNIRKKTKARSRRDLINAAQRIGFFSEAPAGGQMAQLEKPAVEE
ncbi:MAG: response regulator transcription factor [Proteobacteria bacterium]|nr:response regulator transcription factor [Pseudomonadota bacterium]